MIDIAIMASQQSRRVWLQRVIRAEPSLHVAAVAPTFPFLRSLLDETDIDVVIIDLTSGSESETAHEWLSDLVGRIPVVALVSNADANTFNSLIHAESGALLRGDATEGQIIRAIQSASAGLVTFDSTLVPPHEESAALAEPLTPREIEVLGLLAEGFSNREIASRLDVSEHTVKFHIGSILGKLGASTRTEAVTRGLRSGLIEL